MKSYSELCSEYIEMKKRYEFHQNQIHFFSRRLARYLQKQINAPDFYVDMDGKKKPYVSASQVTSIGNEKFTIDRESNDVYYDEESNIHINAIVVVLEISENKFPKYSVPILVSFKHISENNSTEISIFGKKTIELSSEDELEEGYIIASNAIIEGISRSLKTGNFHDIEQGRMGFV